MLCVIGEAYAGPYLFGHHSTVLLRIITFTLESPARAKQDTLLLDRCILEEKVQQMNRRHEEEIGRLQVEFQLERSDLRKAKREVSKGLLVCHPRRITAVVHCVPTHMKTGRAKRCVHLERGAYVRRRKLIIRTYHSSTTTLLQASTDLQARSTGILLPSLH